MNLTTIACFAGVCFLLLILVPVYAACVIGGWADDEMERITEGLEDEV